MDINTLVLLEFLVLLVGTIYAWYNWVLVLLGRCKTCSVSVHDSPFTSKCFWGALFFTVALLINIWMILV